MIEIPPTAARRQRDEPVGLCAECRHADLVRSTRGSTFYRCRRSDFDPAFPRYPALPVVTCIGYERAVAPPRR